MIAVLAWRAERMPWLRFGAVALFLALAAGPPLLRLPVAWVLLAAFRLRDDLADRHRDAQRAPDRVLVNTTDLTPFLNATLAAFAAGILGATLLTGWTAAVLLLPLVFAFEALYRHDVGTRHRWVLLKYPVFVAALGGTSPATLLLVYLSFAIFERIDDPALSARPGAPARLVPLLLLALPAVLPLGLRGLGLWALCSAAALWGITTRRRALAPAYFLLTLSLWL